MADTYKIPLSNTPQRFEITIGGLLYTWRTWWNNTSEVWNIDIYDGETPLVLALPMVAGVDLLAQFRFLGLEGILATYTDGDPYAPPTLENLGTSGNLYLVI